MKRLDAETLAERVRARNTRRMISYRERLIQKGMQQLAIWIPGEIRQQIDTAAGMNGRTLSAECAELLAEGFMYREISK